MDNDIESTQEWDVYWSQMFALMSTLTKFKNEPKATRLETLFSYTQKLENKYKRWPQDLNSVENSESDSSVWKKADHI